ncbi:MAG: endonuclease NucS [Candidatus Jordarchaeaceae archaeon]
MRWKTIDEEKIFQLLREFKNSQHFKEWHTPRQEKQKYNHEWINPEKIKEMPDDELKRRFIEYYSGGEGRQTLNQIWRDRIIRDVSKFREMVTYLLDESISVEERFSNVVSSNGNYHIDGVGKALASAFLMDFKPEKYCVWNNKTEMGFSVLEWSTPYESSHDVGTKYVKVLEKLKELRDIIGKGLDLDFDQVDNFLHWIAAEEEGINVVKSIIGDSGLQETGMVLEALEEKIVQKLLERNFENIFAPLNLKLYDGDPDQFGALFNTPAGIIDFLAVNKNTGDFIVVELKVGKVSDCAIGQILRYMGYVKTNLAGEKNVRGIILAEEIDDKSKYALTMTPEVEFKKYKLNIQLV